MTIFSFQTLAQAESRAHRIGQQNPVTCRYLMASKTADDIIWNMLKAKQDVLNKAGIFCENLQDATLTSAPTTVTRNKLRVQKIILLQFYFYFYSRFSQIKLKNTFLLLSLQVPPLCFRQVNHVKRLLPQSQP